MICCLSYCPHSLDALQELGHIWCHLRSRARCPSGTEQPSVHAGWDDTGSEAHHDCLPTSAGQSLWLEHSSLWMPPGSVTPCCWPRSLPQPPFFFVPGALGPAGCDRTGCVQATHVQPSWPTQEARTRTYWGRVKAGGRRHAWQEVTPHQPSKPQQGLAKELKELRAGTKCSENEAPKAGRRSGQLLRHGSVPLLLMSEWLLLLPCQSPAMLGC